MTIKLSGVALITGAGSGIGRACAKEFIDAGCRHLVLVDRDSTGLENTIKLLNTDSARVTTHTLDVLDSEAVEKLVAGIPAKHGRLDYALNCAGVLGGPGRLHEVDMKEIDTILNINLRAQIVFSRAELKAMLLNPLSDSGRRGVIVNWSSVAGFVAPSAENGAYVVSKHAIAGLTKSLASAYGKEGIRVNAVAPGYIETGMTKDIDEAAKQYFNGRIPMGRSAQAEEVAKVVTFLCSEGASYMNGAIVPIDGGALCV